jgi:serine/alanine adding enzyme
MNLLVLNIFNQLISDKNFPKYYVEWENFVQHHPRGTIFQSPWYYKIFDDDKFTRPVALLLFDENKNIKGILLSVIQYQLPVPFRFLTARSVIIGGSIVENDDPSFAKMLLSKYDRYIQPRVIYSQIRNNSDLEAWRNPLEIIGYIFEEHLT